MIVCLQVRKEKPMRMYPIEEYGIRIVNDLSRMAYRERRERATASDARCSTRWKIAQDTLSHELFSGNLSNYLVI